MSEEVKPNPDQSPDGAAQAAPPPSESSAEGATEPTIDMDAALAAEDPAFVANMKELAAIKTPDGVVIESSVGELELMADDLGSKDAELAEHDFSLRGRIKRLRKKIKYILSRPGHWIAVFRKGGLPLVLKTLKQIIIFLNTEVKPKVGHFFSRLNYRIEKAQEFVKYSERHQKLLMLSAFLLTVALGAMVSFAIQKKSLLFWKEHEFVSFEHEAGEVWEVEADEAFFDFYSSWMSPQFFVRFEKMVVNLRPTLGSDLPMGAFQFYLEGSTQEAAVELKDREKEIRNIIQLTLREMSYEELASAVGLSKSKSLIAADVNKILTQGRVRRVLVDTIVLKP